ncbi:a-factor receptor [Tilletia horrida]|nr:a-factor receptor [Tilletia horrida]KAK0536800.1 a-factor receptor [Tilletia horrida]
MHGYHVFTPFAGIGLVLLLALLPWHLRAKNLAVFLLCGWLFLQVLSFFVNSIAWWDNVDIKAEVWCDISTKLIYSGQIGPVCCSLCVLRRLEAIASTRTVRTTEQDRRKQMLFDLAIGLGIPIVFTALHIVNQGHRYDIVEGFGCLPAVYWTPVAIVLNLIPPLLVSLTAVVYGALALRWFIIRRRQFNAILQASCTHIDRSRYMRLMAMACIEALVSFPINLGTFADKLEYQKRIYPWISWEDTHYDFGFIGQYKAALYSQTADSRRHWRTLELGRWGIVVGCYCVFAFFGTSAEATQFYVKLWHCCLHKIRTVWSSSPVVAKRPGASPIVAIQTSWQTDSALQSVKIGPSEEDIRGLKSTISDQEKV